MGEVARESEVPAQTGKAPGEPDSPMELSKGDWKETLTRTVKEMKHDRVSFTAGALAYYWFLALFPAVIALVGLVGLLRLPASTVQSLVKGITTALPAGAAQIITTSVHGASQGSAGTSVAVIVGVAVAVWSASSGMAALTTGLNIAYDVDEDRKFIGKRLNALVLMTTTLVLGGIAAALVVFGQPLGVAISKYIPVGGSIFVYAWTVVRWVAAILVVTLLFSALFYLGPKRKSPKWQWVTPGGLIGSIVWLAASLGFSFYVSASGSYTKTYGALAGVAILILWLYITGIAILAGAELNAELERQSEARSRRVRVA